MSLGERIASYRKKAGYSQEGLAEQLGGDIEAAIRQLAERRKNRQ